MPELYPAKSQNSKVGTDQTVPYDGPFAGDPFRKLLGPSHWTLELSILPRVDAKPEPDKHQKLMAFIGKSAAGLSGLGSVLVTYNTSPWISLGFAISTCLSLLNTFGEKFGGIAGILNSTKQAVRKKMGSHVSKNIPTTAWSNERFEVERKELYNNTDSAHLIKDVLKDIKLALISKLMARSAQQTVERTWFKLAVVAEVALGLTGGGTGHFVRAAGFLIAVAGLLEEIKILNVESQIKPVKLKCFEMLFSSPLKDKGRDFHERLNSPIVDEFKKRILKVAKLPAAYYPVSNALTGLGTLTLFANEPATFFLLGAGLGFSLILGAGTAYSQLIFGEGTRFKLAQRINKLKPGTPTVLGGIGDIVVGIALCRIGSLSTGIGTVVWGISNGCLGTQQNINQANKNYENYKFLSETKFF